MYKVLLLWMSMIAVWSSDVLSHEIQAVRVWTTPENTRLVLDLSDSVQYKVFTLHAPERVVLDLPHTTLKASFQAKQWVQSGIKTIRSSQQSANMLRIVLDLEQPMESKVFLLSPEGGYGHRLVVDLGKPKPSQALKSPVKTTTGEFLVAIDAGHGGQDPGSIGRHIHIREKDVVLSVAKKLKKMIDAKKGMRAYLVREGDYYISLRKRMELGRSQGADLFISIHADSFKDPRASGASVFVLSEKGASNEAARWLAERENRADLVGGVRLEDKGDLLASVLLDLSQTASQTASDELAGHLIGQLGKITDLHHKTVQRAGFMVLKSPDIPSVLVELGFLSNPKGEVKLSNEAHQTALAKALFSGVNAYAAARPSFKYTQPSHSIVAKKRSYKRA